MGDARLELATLSLSSLRRTAQPCPLNGRAGHDLGHASRKRASFALAAGRAKPTQLSDGSLDCLRGLGLIGHVHLQNERGAAVAGDPGRDLFFVQTATPRSRKIVGTPA
jgi:hypothetical protein